MEIYLTPRKISYKDRLDSLEVLVTHEKISGDSVRPILIEDVSGSIKLSDIDSVKKNIGKRVVVITKSYFISKSGYLIPNTFDYNDAAVWAIDLSITKTGLSDENSFLTQTIDNNCFLIIYEKFFKKDFKLVKTGELDKILQDCDSTYAVPFSKKKIDKIFKKKDAKNVKKKRPKNIKKKDNPIIVLGSNGRKQLRILNGSSDKNKR